MAGGGFENTTNYSYGYIARVAEHQFYESKGSKNLKRFKRGLSKQEEAEAELVLVEKAGNESIASTKNRLTPKKFFLIGSNKETGEVEVTGLVSLIQYQHRGIQAKCNKTEEKGAIRDGSCDKVFFPAPSGKFSETPKFIKEELHKPDGTSVSWMELPLKGKSLGVVWGQRKLSGSNSENKWSRTGYLYLGERSGGKVNKARKVWTQLNNHGTSNKKVALFFVVHDLIFQEGVLKGEYKKKYDTYKNISAGNTKNSNEFQVSDKDIRSGGKKELGKLIDIHLSSDRNYWIWDPTKTKIKNEEFITDDGKKLPFKLSVNATWNSSLIK